MLNVRFKKKRLLKKQRKVTFFSLSCCLGAKNYTFDNSDAMFIPSYCKYSVKNCKIVHKYSQYCFTFVTPKAVALFIILLFYNLSKLMSIIIFYLIIAFLLLDYLFDAVLGRLNDKQWAKKLPSELSNLYDEAQYQKARNYHKANKKIGRIGGLLSLVVSLGLIIGGGFGLLDNWLRTFTDHPIGLAVAFFGILGLASDLLGLPFDLYHTFVIEQRFGFNKMTIGTFIADKLKGYLLGGILGGGLLALLVWCYGWAGSWFWLYGWVAVTLVSLFMVIFGTSVVMPLFNKLTPLEAGELRHAIEEYAQKVNFPLKNIFVMDGSKRSAKANAFFSGLGSQKSIVLYDTLIAEQSIPELVAVLAHEVGHYKLKHIPQNVVLSILQTGILFFLLGLALNRPELSEALGAKPSFHIGLLAFMLLYSPISTLIGILMNIFSRKNEFEADRYARETYAGEPLQSALKKLSVNHLSNLTPHPWYVFVYYSHPPLLERLQALRTG